MRSRPFENEWAFCQFKKYQFYQNEVCFLRYVVSAQKVQMEDEKIKVIKNWPKLKSVRDIQVFLVLPIFINILSKVSVT